MKKYLFFSLFYLFLFVFTITCKKEISVVDIRLHRTSLTLSVGDTGILIVTVLPENATNKKVLWVSDNPAVISIVNGMLIAKGEGTAIITVTTLENDKTANCNLQVNRKVEGEPEMIIVKGGTFPMGCTDQDCFSDRREEPVHNVTLNHFKISKYPITQKQWKAIMGTNPSHFKGDNLPVEQITWNDAQEFISTLNTLTGKNYRLPTEAEWEYAARGGHKGKGYKYSGSNDVDDVAWYLNNADQTTHPVGTKASNELGIYDMSGNVLEWCDDWYDSYSFHIYPPVPTGIYRVCRGGAWSAGSEYCRVSARTQVLPNNFRIHLGFRVVLPI